MTLPNIALTGHIRAGKDAIGAYLVERYGYTRFAFADEIRRIGRELYPDEFRGGAKPRELLQWLGQTLRQRDPDVWVARCFDKIAWKASDVEAANAGFARHSVHKLPLIPFHAVITDLRQPNEFARCRAEGYVVIRVKAQSALRIHRAALASDMFNLADLSHETESHVDSFDVDFDVVNDGTLPELYAKVDEIIAQLRT